MNRRELILPLATAGIASILIVGAAAGQEPEDTTDAQAPAVETRQGTVESTTDADGDVEYQLTDANGTIELGVGPHWFWGENHPLADVSDDVTVTGELDNGTPSDRANEANRADGESSFDVFSVNGNEIRAAGKPPWAGGPAVVGASHPGHAGWSRGQAAGGDAGD